MKRINCIVQEDQFSKEDIRNIESGYREIYTQNYSEEDLKIFWMIFPKGYAFSERKPSNAMVILVEVDDDISKDKREEMMTLFSQFMMSKFNISPLDTVITVANTSWIDSFLAAQQKRIQPLFRPWINLKTMYTALISKWSDGFLKVRVKY